MSEAPKVHVATTVGANSRSDLSRAVTDGVSRAAAVATPAERIRIGTLRINAGPGTDPKQLSEAVRREIARAAGRTRP